MKIQHAAEYVRQNSFDIFSQSKQKPRSKRRYKIKIKVYANKTGCPNIIHGWDFLSSNLMNNFITYTFSKQSYESDHYDRLFHAYLKFMSRFIYYILIH